MADRAHNIAILSDAQDKLAKAKALIADSTLDATTIGRIRMLSWAMEIEVQKLKAAQGGA